MVDDKLFLEKMATCKGLLSTAGFESVCEAMYLGKQVLMVPVKGQYEQACNAIDAQLSGAGLIGEKFDFKKLDAYLKAGTTSTTTDKEWIDSFQFIFHDFLRHSLQNKKEVFLIDFTEEIPAL